MMECTKRCLNLPKAKSLSHVIQVTEIEMMNLLLMNSHDSKITCFLKAFEESF